MTYVPRLRHLLKIALRLRDPQAAEGLFLEGSIEFESGDVETARLMFYYGTRLDPRLAGNFYNYAVATETLNRPMKEIVLAWENYLSAAEKDPRQSATAIDRARRHVAELKSHSSKTTD